MSGYLNILCFITLCMTRNYVSSPCKGNMSADSHCRETREQRKVFTLTQVILSLNFSSICLFSDQTSNDIDTIHRRLQDEEQFSLATFVTMDADRARDLVRVGILEKTENRLFIIISSLDYLETALNFVSSAVTEKFLFYSRWLIVTEHYPSMGLARRFENMAVIIHKDINKTLTQFSCDSIETLKIDGDERHFSPIQRKQIHGIHALSSISPDRFRTIVFPNPRGGLNGRTVRIGTAPWYPYIMKTENGSLYGHSIDLIGEMATILNFTPVYVEFPSNGSEWLFLYNKLGKKELDMLSVPLLQSKQRLQTMDYIFPAASFGEYYVFYKAPKDGDHHWRVIWDTMSWVVLVLISISLLCSACLLAIGDRLNGCNHTFVCTPDAEILVLTKTYLWVLFGNLLKQGQVFISRQESVSSRTVLSAWCLFCLVYSVMFTVILVPALGVSKQPVLFRTIDNLLQNNDYKWGIYGHGNMMVNFLKTSQKKEHRDLYRGIVRFNQSDPEVLFLTVNQNVKRMLTEKYAFISSTRTMEIYSNECEIVHIDELLVTLPNYYVVYKDSPLTALFSDKLYTLFESGQWQRMLQTHTRNRTCSKGRRIPGAVGMSHITSVLLLGTIGIALAIITFFGEMWISRKFHSD